MTKKQNIPCGFVASAVAQRMIYKIYIFGAITNDPDHKKKFEDVANKLRENGYTVLSPIETEGYRFKMSEKICMFDALEKMKEADAVLPVNIEISNIEISEGASIEYLLAKKCKMPIITMKDLNL